MKFTSILPLFACCSSLLAYDLHEWGTFTTVSGSDGVLLTGLEVEEEKLPSFVYSHAGMDPGYHLHNNNTYGYQTFIQSPQVSLQGAQVRVRYDEQKKQFFHFSGNAMAQRKGVSYAAQLRNVTVKMETPVIYFYGGEEGEQVNVKVGFNGGTISQWYPERKSGDVPNEVTLFGYQLSPQLKSQLEGLEDYTFVESEPIDFSENYQGAIEWDVELMKADEAFTFKHEQSPTWIYPRVPNANMVKVGEEYEDYLFYRGVGNLELPITLSVNDAEEVIIENKSSEAIPFSFAYEKVGDVVRYKVVGEVKDVASVPESEWTVAEESWRPEIFSEIRAGLVDVGLTEEEATGMVKTWWKSYFEQDGLRIFWVVPQTELDQILPMQVSPAPEEMVRVIVGRGDILRPSFEQKLISSLGKKEFNQFERDRFAAAYRNRLEAIIKKPIYQHMSEEELNSTPLSMTRYIADSVLSSTIYLQIGKEAKSSAFGKLGAWKIVSENELQIGELVFTRPEDSGVFTATVPQSDKGSFRYEIQLRKYLN